MAPKKKITASLKNDVKPETGNNAKTNFSKAAQSSRDLKELKEALGINDLDRKIEAQKDDRKNHTNLVTGIFFVVVAGFLGTIFSLVYDIINKDLRYNDLQSNVVELQSLEIGDRLKALEEKLDGLGSSTLGEELNSLRDDINAIQIK